MLDLVFIVVTLVLLAVSCAYVYGCDRL